MKLYFLVANIKNLQALEYNLTILFRLLFPAFHKLISRKVDNYYLITPYYRGDRLIEYQELPLPPLHQLSLGILSLDSNYELSSLFMFEFLGRKMYVIDRDETSLFDTFYREFSAPMSGPSFSTMSAATNAINGRIPIYTVYTKYSVPSILEAYKHVILDNPYMVAGVSHIRRVKDGVWKIPFLDEESKNRFVASLRNVDLMATEVDLVTSIALRRTIPAYYFEGIIYTETAPPLIDKTQILDEIMSSLSQCYSGIELTSLSNISELSETERANTIMLSDQSCVNINPASLEYFLRRPFSLKTNLPLEEADEIDIAIHDASIVGYYPIKIGDATFTTGFEYPCCTQYEQSPYPIFPSVSISDEIEFRGRTLYVDNTMIGTSSRELTKEEVELFGSKLYKILSSYAKAYMYEYGVIPEYLIGNRTVSRYLFSNVDSLLSYLRT